MGTSDLFRNLEWQIETRLANKTIENLRKGWDWEKTPEENLTFAVTDAVPFIFECYGRWCDEMLRRDQEQVESEMNHPPCNL